MPRRTCRWCGETAGAAPPGGSPPVLGPDTGGAFFPRGGAPASRVRGIGRQARRAGIRVVFVEPLGERRVAETIAREVGGTTAVLDPLESLTVEAQRAGKNYFTVMHENLAQLAQGLDCR